MLDEDGNWIPLDWDTDINTYSKPAAKHFGALANDAPGMSAVIPNSIGAGIAGTERPDEPEIPWDKPPDDNKPPDDAAKPGLDPKTEAGIEAGIAILNEVTKAIETQKAQPTTRQMGKKTRDDIGKRARKKYDL